MRYQKVQRRLDAKHLNTLQVYAPLNMDQFSPSAVGRPIWCHVIPHTQTLSMSPIRLLWDMLLQESSLLELHRLYAFCVDFGRLNPEEMGHVKRKSE